MFGPDLIEIGHSLLEGKTVAAYASGSPIHNDPSVHPDTTRWHDGSCWLHVRHVATSPRYRGDSLSGVILVNRAELPFGITPRELDALTLAAYGLTNNQIAARLFISARTAGHHVENAIVKLGASNRASCVSLAVAHGLVSGRALIDMNGTSQGRRLA